MHAPVQPDTTERAVPAGKVFSPGLVIFALSIGGFAIGTSEFAAMALVPFFSTDLGVSEARAADAISAYALGVVVGAPLLAVAGAKLSRRKLLVALMLAMAVFNVASVLAPNWGSFLVLRFLSGLPHGTYFGVASLVAASVVPKGKRATAVARVMLGIPVATTLGVPVSSYMGQTIGWEWSFGIAGLLGLVTAAAAWFIAPRGQPAPGASAMRELSALGNRQVLLTLITGAIGFGGFFAVYTYLSSTVISVIGRPEMVPVVLFIAGLGMIFSSLFFGWLADRSQNAAGYGAMIFGIIIMLLFVPASNSLWAILPIAFFVSWLGGLSTVLQTRLMDVAGDAQQMAAAMNHAAFNVANALGPFLAARAIAAGYGFSSAGYVGAALAFGGLVLFAITVADARRRG